MRLFVSQPMRGKTAEEILTERNAAFAMAEEEYDDVELIDSYKPELRDVHPLDALAMSIGMIAAADAAMFLAGWQNARGCRVEHEICRSYGIPIYFEAEEEETSPWEKLPEDIKAVTGDLTVRIMRKRGRGFASGAEAWATVKASLEYIKEDAKRAEKLHGELWDAVRDHEEEAYFLDMKEFAKAAKTAASGWIAAAAYAEIAQNDVEEI